mgnify:CR=1 FL=1
MEPESKTVRIASDSCLMQVRKTECADPGISVLHEHGSKGNKAESEACMTDGCLGCPCGSYNLHPFGNNSSYLKDMSGQLNLDKILEVMSEEKVN